MASLTRSLTAALCCAWACGRSAATTTPAHPNIFLVLADDFGHYNVGWRNPEIRSPHIDAMAASGLKLNRHYVFKYCSPSRSSLLSGRLPLHVNQNNECNLVASRSGIDVRMTLLPAKMKEAGYATSMVGKSHLGARTPANLPANRGFDQHFGFLKGGEDHMTQCLSDADGFYGPDLWRNHGPAVGENGTFSTFLYGHEAVRVVEAHDTAAPLFMYLAFQVTHSPYEIPPGYEQASDPVERRTFNAMVNIMDEAVSNLTQALDRKAMLDNTLIVFSADNGGVYHGGQLGNNYPLRGQKTSSWEGGVRATAFVWGGKATAFPEHVRGTETDVFVHICDWYATLATLVGVDPTDSKHAGEGVPAIDSVDQWDVLMRANTTFSDSVRKEVPLAFCPDTPTSKGIRGPDNCCPTAEGGGWKPNGTKLQPHEWRNGALILLMKGRATTSYYKLIWGQQFGFGVWTSAASPNATGASHKSTDPGCPAGCLFDIIADEGEHEDIKAREPEVFAAMVARQQEIGLGVYQTNYSDVDSDADCISISDMVDKYGGFLGPRCGV